MVKKLFSTVLLALGLCGPGVVRAGQWTETAENPEAICNPTILVGTGVYNLQFTIPAGCSIMKVYAQGSGGNSWNSVGVTGATGGGGGAFFGILLNVQPGDTYSVTAGASADYSDEGGYGAPMRLVKGTGLLPTQNNLVLIVGGGGGGGAALNGTPGPGGAGGFYGQQGGFGHFTYSRQEPAIAGGGGFGHVFGGQGGIGTPADVCNDGGVGAGGYSQLPVSNASGEGGDGGAGWYQGGGGAGCAYVGFPPPGSGRFAGGGGGGGSSKTGDFVAFESSFSRFFNGDWNLPGGLALPHYTPTYGFGGTDGTGYLGGAAHYRISWGDITVSESRFPPGDFSGSEACSNLSTTSHSVTLSDPPCANNPSMTCRGDYDANGLSGPGSDAICSYHCPSNSDTYVFRVDC